MVGRSRSSGVRGLPDVGRDRAKAAGVFVFGGGIDESVPPALVSADGAVAEGGCPRAPRLDRGLTELERPSAVRRFRRERAGMVAKHGARCRSTTSAAVPKSCSSRDALAPAGKAVWRMRHFHDTSSADRDTGGWVVRAHFSAAFGRQLRGPAR